MDNGQSVKQTVSDNTDNLKEQIQTTNKLTAETKADTGITSKKEVVDTEKTLPKNTQVKEEKPVNIQNNVSQTKDIKTAETKIETANANNQNRAAEYVNVDKKSTNETINKNNTESENILVNKAKTVKAVASNKETDQQKPDSQNQNTFDRTAVNMSKLNQYGKDIKETVKVVDQSRLMNEIENLVKSGERKVVKLNLYPEDLGSVKISLDVNNKIVTAKIDVTNDAVRQMRMTQSDSLKSALTQSGIQLASLNVSVNNFDEKTSQQQGKMKRKGGSVERKSAIKDVPSTGTKVKNLGYNTYDYIV